jgi:Tfp pilus assembly protein PilO
MSEDQNQYGEEQEFSPEEIQQQKEELMEFYKSALPQLEAQFEYETMIADIEEARLRRVMAQARIAQILAPPMEEEDDAPQQRTLKRK